MLSRACGCRLIVENVVLLGDATPLKSVPGKPGLRATIAEETHDEEPKPRGPPKSEDSTFRTRRFTRARSGMNERGKTLRNSQSASGTRSDERVRRPENCTGGIRQLSQVAIGSKGFERDGARGERRPIVSVGAFERSQVEARMQISDLRATVQRALRDGLLCEPLVYTFRVLSCVLVCVCRRPR